MGNPMNLYMVSLACLAISTFTAADVTPTRSRLALTFIHWDRSNVNGSYFKLKNDPLRDTTYVVTVNSTYYNMTSNKSAVASASKTLPARSDINGLLTVHIEWPNGVIATSFGFSVKEQGKDTVVSAQLQSTSPSDESIYYPSDEMSSNTSMVFFDGKWQPVWDNPDETWLVNEKNPQQLQVIELNSTYVLVYCFVCARGLSSQLGNYSLTIHGKAANSTMSLLMRNSSDHGMAHFVFNQTNITGYSLTFTLGTRTWVSSSGPAHPLRPAAKEYIKVLREKVDSNEVLMNEVHFPMINGSKPAEKSFWIELIGRPGANLSRYCISLENGTSTPCWSIDKGGVTNNKGYYIFSLDDKLQAKDFLYDHHNKIYTFRLYREDQVSMSLLDYASFAFTNKTESSRHSKGNCVGEAGRCLQTSTAECNTLCLRIRDVLYGAKKRSLSRCGIQKSPDINERTKAMSVWYVTSVSNKLWNNCPRPRGALTRIGITESMVTVSARNDSLDGFEMRLHQHLPYMGLRLMFWHKSVSSGPPSLMAVPLEGADLSISSQSDSMSKMNITLRKIEPAGVSGAMLFAKGANLSSVVRGKIYAIALVHCYSFLCDGFNITAQFDRVVDAVVYSAKNTSFDLQMISLFMNIADTDAEQGQIVLDKVSNPILISDGIQPRNTDSWKGVGAVAPYKLDKMYMSAQAQKHIRIMRVGSNANPYIKISLVDLPDNFAKVYKQGVPLNKLCLDVSISAGNAWKTLSLKELTDMKLLLTESKTIPMTKFGGVPDVLDHSGDINFVMLFRDSNESEVCNHHFTRTQQGFVNRDVMTFIVDVVKISYADVPKEDALLITDNKEVARCNSMKPGLMPAYSVVDKEDDCPVPHDLYIYKLCQRIIGVASDRENFTAFPTDYLYLVLVDDTMQIVNVTSLTTATSILRFSYNVISSPRFIIEASNKTVLSFALGWFPNGPPQVRDILVNHTLSFVVAYPHKDLESVAISRHTKLLETAENPQNAEKPIVVYKPSTMDRRHCVIGCRKRDPMQEVINFELKNYRLKDEMCQASYTKEYQHVLINEINADTKGFKDKGEYVELRGAKRFPYVSGLSIAIIDNIRGEIVYKMVQHVTDTNKMFSDKGFFVFERNQIAASTSNYQNMPHMRFLPNDFGAVAVLWGAQLVTDVEKYKPVLDEHVNLPDFILDVVVYAHNHTLAHDDRVNGILRKFASKEKTLKGNVAIEKLGAVNHNETISRCFCTDPWNMDCFEMSFNETENATNVCPTAFRKTIDLCVDSSNFNDEDGSKVIAEEIERYMADSSNCANVSCSFSKYQVKDFTHCSLTEPGTEMWTFNVGFPTQQHFDLLEKLITPETLIDAGAKAVIKCVEDACPAVSPSAAPLHSSNAAIIGGVIGGLALLIILVVVIMVCRKRLSYRKDLTARFEAANDEEGDDCTFLPDGGSVSFSNPHYNQNNGSRRNSNGTKKVYQKLSTST